MFDIFPETSTIDGGHLVIGGCDVPDLVERFGTPMWVFDRATLEARARSFAKAIDLQHVYYAAKSFTNVAVFELLDRLGLSIDVCTGGELATAVAGGFPSERLIFHGNNKSQDELVAARDAGVGRVVVDSFEEIDRVAASGLRTKLLVRVTPGVEAHTHEFVQTGQEDSKFGFSLHEGIALQALERAAAIDGCELVGIHAHIGSQIFEMAAFELAAARLAGLAATAKQRFDLHLAELDLGGGLGIAHTQDELTPDPAESVERIRGFVDKAFAEVSLPAPDLYVEPGRALIGASMVTVYRVGTVKRIPGVRTYVAVDGGMSDDTDQKGISGTDKVFVAVDGGMGDNIRPALYGAKYEAFLANRMDAPDNIRAEVVGKYCESGDFLIKNAHLPHDVAPGDLLCIPATGAYTYSMASNYNRTPRPAVVMVHEGQATVIAERETVGDLLRLDRRLDGSAL